MEKAEHSSSIDHEILQQDIGYISWQTFIILRRIRESARETFVPNGSHVDRRLQIGFMRSRFFTIHTYNE